jgi:replication factor C subunit 3/5
MLWVDKYRPHTLDKFQHANADIATHLKRLVADGDCPHLLFYGVSGAGKKTLALAVLREIFGPSVEKVKVEGKTWKLEQGDRKIEVELTTLSSNYHVEMNPSDVGTKDRYVVQEVIKDMARSRPIDAAGERGFKVLLLNEVDRLSKEAQHGLRRTMEKYSQACRLILICNSVSKVLDAVRSRCLPIRVGAPTDAQVETLLNDVARREKLTLPPELAARVALHAERNMRRALLSLEAARVQQYPFKADQQVAGTDWEAYVAQIAGELLGEQSPKRLLQIRGRLYELLVNCIPPEVLLRRLVRELNRRLDAELKHETAKWAAHYEHRLQEGQKPIIHLEGFVAQFMATYKKYLISSFG